MMEVEPKNLVYRDVRLNQSYSTSLCISNPLTASVEFTLRPSSPRYTVSPNRVNLMGGQSIVVTVRLFLTHFPNYSKGVKGQDDHIVLKSSYFEQKVDVTFFLHSRDSSSAASRSQSPSRVGEKRSKELEIVEELHSQLKLKDDKIRLLEQTVGYLESKHPSIQEILRNRVEQERTVFEEKSEKVCYLVVAARVLHVDYALFLCRS